MCRRRSGEQKLRGDEAEKNRRDAGVTRKIWLETRRQDRRGIPRFAEDGNVLSCGGLWFGGSS